MNGSASGVAEETKRGGLTRTSVHDERTQRCGAGKEPPWRSNGPSGVDKRNAVVVQVLDQLGWVDRYAPSERCRNRIAATAHNAVVRGLSSGICHG